MKAVGYISSYRSHELDREIELKIQRERIAEFCKNNAIELLKLYEESKDSREDYKPELLKLIDSASSKTIDKVIVLKFEKFGQEKLVQDWVVEELHKQSVKVHSLTESSKSTSGITNEKALKKANNIKLNVRDIPSLPEVVTKIMELVQDPNSSAAQLSKVISHDPGLTSRVLRLVNSAYYGFPKQISSIQHAIMILGFTTMRGLVLSSSIFKIFAPKPGVEHKLDYKKFWKHSLVTAVASKTIKNHLYLQEEDDVFSSAILHDIGKIILDQYDHENYINALTKASNPLKSEQVLFYEEEFCSVNHQDIGFLVTDGWNLPDTITDVIRFHHTPLESENNSKLTSIVNIGNILSHLILDQTPFDVDFFDQEITEHLGIGAEDLWEISQKIQEQVEDLGNFESFFK